MPDPTNPRTTTTLQQSQSESAASDRDETAAAPPRPTSDAPKFGPPAAPGEVGMLGPYRLVKELGKGGMGAVHLALDTRLDRKLALKVMLPEFAADPESKERFLREARAAAKITHDNVVTVYEADERDGVPYIAMQFLQGTPLDGYLKQKGAPALAHVIRIGREAALGLAAAHALGLVHRDVKPANLWLEAPNGRVKVLDFGLAKPVGADAELTKSGAVVGTPAYMSPEQARGLKVDARTDLFSLGAVLYRLCTGQNPFAGEHVMAVLAALVADDPAPVRERNPSVPEPLAQLIHQLLSKKPEQRPPTAAEVAKRLRTILDQMLAPAPGAPPSGGSVPGGSADVSTSLPVVVNPVPTQPPVVVPMSVTAAPESVFADLGADEPAEAAAAACTADAPRPGRAQPERKRSGGTGVWIATGLAVLLAVAAGVIVIKIKNKDGTETEIKVPDGATVEVTKDGKTLAQVGPESKPVTKKGPPPDWTIKPRPLPVVEVPPWELPAGAPKPAVVPFPPEDAVGFQDAWAKHLKVPVDAENKLGMKFRLIPPGEFERAFTWNRVEKDTPKGRARVTRAFYLATTSVTIGQFRKFVEATGYKTEAEVTGRGVSGPGGPGDRKVTWRAPGYEATDDHPVSVVSHGDAQAFCDWLSAREGAVYRLPTEAEWELAARAGGSGEFGSAPTEDAAKTLVWCKENTHNGRPAPVGKLKATPFGLFDIGGNVSEYVTDGVVRPGGPWSPVDPRCPGGLMGRGGAFNSSVNEFRPLSSRIMGSWLKTNGGFRVLRQVTADSYPPPGPFPVRPGQPLSQRATVPRPDQIPGLRSWSIEPRFVPRAHSLALSPDGARVALAHHVSPGIWVYDREGRLVNVLTGNDVMVGGMALSRNGKYLAACEYGDRSLTLITRVWEVETGKCVAAVPQPGWLWEVEWSPSDDRLALPRPGEHVVILDVPTGRSVEVTIPVGHVGPRVAWSAGGRGLVASAGNSLHGLELDGLGVTGSWSLTAADLGLKEPNWGRPLFRGADVLAVGSGATVHVVDVRARKLLATLTTDQGENIPLRWTETGALVTRGPGWKLVTWDVAEQKATSTVQMMAGDGFGLTADGKEFVTSDGGRPVFLDAATGKTLRQAVEPPKTKLDESQLIPHPNGKTGWLVRGETVQVLDLATLEKTGEWSIPFVPQRGYANWPRVFTSGAGDRLAIIGETQWAVVNSDTGNVLWQTERPKAAFTWVEWGPDGTRLAEIRSASREVAVWDVAAGRATATLRGHEGDVTSVAWSPDGTRLATVASDETVRLWAANGTSLRVFRDFPAGQTPTNRCPAIQWAGDENHVFGVLGGRVSQIDLATGVWSPPEWFPESGVGHVFIRRSPDGRSLLAFGASCASWRAAATADRQFLGHWFGVVTEWLGDSRRIVTSTDGWDWHGGRTGYDVLTGRRLGTFVANVGGRWCSIGPTGHYRGQDGVDKYLVYVAQHDDGSQAVYTPAEFAKKFDWTNDPARANPFTLDP